MSDAAELKFNEKDRENIKKCLKCPLPDCSMIACPYLIPDEAKAHVRYQNKKKKKQKRRNKQ